MAISNHIQAQSTAAYRAYKILHVGFIVAPLLAGLDKFFNLLVDWSIYVPSQVSNVVPASTLMPIVGVIEIVAAFVVMTVPRFGGYVVAAWLWAIILNLLLIPGFYDVALRDFGLSLGALALAQLAQEFHGARRY